MYGFIPACAPGALTLGAAALWLAAVPAHAGPASGGSVMAARYGIPGKSIAPAGAKCDPARRRRRSWKNAASKSSRNYCKNSSSKNSNK